MSRRKLTVQGRGPDGCVTFSLEAYQGKVWITSYDCSFTCEAILDPAQADNVISLINRPPRKRGYRL
jgi:hypothetical protein